MLPRDPVAAAEPLPDRSRLRDRLLVVAFLLILGVPGAATMTSLRTVNVAGRPAAGVQLRSVIDLGRSSLYREVDAYLADRFPLAGVAAIARANAYEAFGAAPDPRVVVGRDGWLYHIQEAVPVCGRSGTQLLAQVDHLATAFSELGTKFMLVVVPNKRTIYPEPLAGTWAAGQNCTDIWREALFGGLAARSDSGLDLLSPLRDARATSEYPLFWHSDTHWSTDGMAIAIRALLERYPEVEWEPAAISERQQISFTGDLYRLMGLVDRKETATAFTIQRGVTSTRQTLNGDFATPTGFPAFRITNSGSVPLVPERTLFVYDSFFHTAQPLISPWFADSIWINIDDVGDPRTVATLPDFDSVVVERVERYAYADFERRLAPILDRKRASVAAGGS